MSTQELTICSVSFHSKSYLRLNRDLVRHLNPNQELKWLVIENTPAASDERIENHSSHFFVSDGCEFDPSKLRPASYHHGVALNKALGLVKTRLVMLLDPDFFIVRKNWITELVQHMEENKLVFFGVPYHPQWHIKYRYFPCAHCMFIDLDRVDRGSLDFRPGQEIQRLRGRKGIGISQDTGYRLYERYSQQGRVQSECVIPVYGPGCENPKRSRLLTRFLDKVLPDRLSYLPKRPGYYSVAGFRDLGYPDVTAYGWEEFIWKGEPFGFHLRTQPRSDEDPKSEMDRLLRVISNFYR